MSVARRQLLQQAARLAGRSVASLKQIAPGSSEVALQSDHLAHTTAGKAHWSKVCLSFAAAGLMTATEAPIAHAQPQGAGATVAVPNGGAADATAQAAKTYKVAFVLGGPGSGKGTQCSKLVEEFGVVHLSAGDLLRAHIKSGSQDGKMVADMIANGQIVPSSVTVGLLQGAMDASGKSQFLIDGFPRNDENRAAFENQTGIQPTVIFFFDCPEAVMERRLLGRNEGRTDDNAATIRKRFAVFQELSLPVVSHYQQQGKVARISADRAPSDVYKEVRRTFIEFMV